MNPNDMTDTRTNARWSSQKECSLLYEFADIKSQTVVISIWGLGVLVSGHILCKKGDTMPVRIKSLNYSSEAEVIWTKKDKDSTRVGFSLLTRLYD